MAVSLANSSVVIVAQHFNPSITGQHWLIDNRIVLEDEFQVGAVFTDMFVQIPTRNFHLLVVPENCQFTPASNLPPEQQQALTVDRLGKLIELLPHTPYAGVGLNFVWQYFPEREPINTVCRRLFYKQESPLQSQFDVSDAQFGGYASMNYMGCRLGLDVKPVVATLPDGQQSDFVQFAFNYHLGLAGHPDSTGNIRDMLNRWKEARNHSRKMVSISTGEDHDE